MRTGLPSTLIAAAAVFALAACSSSSPPAANGPTPTPGQSQPAPVDTNAPASAATTTSAPSSGSAPPSAPTTVGRSVTDPDLGNKVTVIKYAVGYQPSPAALQSDSGLGDEDIVLVNLTITAGSKFTTTFGSSDFRLEGASTGTAGLPVTGLESELAAAGYPTLKDASPGRTSTGWLAFASKKNQTSYTLLYRRLATKDSAGRSIAAKTFTLALN